MEKRSPLFPNWVRNPDRPARSGVAVRTALFWPPSKNETCFDTKLRYTNRSLSLHNIFVCTLIQVKNRFNFMRERQVLQLDLAIVVVVSFTLWFMVIKQQPEYDRIIDCRTNDSSLRWVSNTCCCFNTISSSYVFWYERRTIASYYSFVASFSRLPCSCVLVTFRLILFTS